MPFTGHTLRLNVPHVTPSPSPSEQLGALSTLELAIIAPNAPSTSPDSKLAASIRAVMLASWATEMVGFSTTTTASA